MNDYKYHYHMTTFDIEIHDLENLNYNFVNLTSYRIVDSSNPMVRHVLRDIERFSPKGKSILNKPNVIQVLISLYAIFQPLTPFFHPHLPIMYHVRLSFHFSLPIIATSRNKKNI